MSTFVPSYGVEDNSDLALNWVQQDARPFHVRHSEAISKSGPVVAILFSLLPLLLPIFVEIITVFGLLLFLFVRRNQHDFIFQEPRRLKKLSFAGEKTVGDGLFYLGFEKRTGRGAWLSADRATRHCLLFGATGSGKSRFILGLIYNALLNGSGCIYVDGKADTDIYWLLYSVCRRLDRIDDFLVINYLSGGKESSSKINPYDRWTNTNNSFSSASSSILTEMVVGLMRDTSGDGEMWKGRAKSLLTGLIRCLVTMRNKGEISFDVSVLRANMPITKVLDLSKREDLGEMAYAPLVSYFNDLPGMTPKEVELWGTDQQQEISEKASEQHNYLTMQLTEILAELGDVFRHIFGVQFGEVSWRNVVFRRKILLVMLPALEKTVDTLAGLGKLIFSGIRSALGPALGYRVEGGRHKVIQAKPSRSKVPMLVVFDEWGNYATQGAGLVVSQARSLGIWLVFGSQDVPGMKKRAEVEKETDTIIGNCDSKFCMRIEDMDETFKIFQMRGGKSYQEMRDGSERHQTTFGHTHSDRTTTRFEERDRINSRDLVAQKPGEAHIIQDDKLARCQLVYIEPKEVAFSQLNQFVIPEMPAIHEITKTKTFRKNIDSAFKGGFSVNSTNDARFSALHDSDSPIKTSPNLASMVKGMRESLSRGVSLHTSSIVASGAMELANRHFDAMLDRAHNEAMQSGATPKGDHYSRKPITDQRNKDETIAQEQYFVDGQASGYFGVPDTQKTKTTTDEPTSTVTHKTEAQQDHTDRYRQLFQGKLNEIVDSSLDSHNLSNLQRRAETPESFLLSAAGIADLEEPEISEDVRKSMASLEKHSLPENEPIKLNPLPQKAMTAELKTLLGMVQAKIDTKDN